MLLMVQKENIMSTPKILEARPLDGYKIWLKFNDGTAGEVDFFRPGGKGVFTFWDERDNFKKVSIEKRWLSWSDEIDLDADSLYLKLTGKKPEELFPAIKEESSYA